MMTGDVDLASPPPAVRPDAPAVASMRASLRRGLPVLLRDDLFTDGFLHALEEVVDPILALLDGIAAHFDTGVAPDDVLEVMAAWLGFALDDEWPEQPRRQLVQHLPELARRQSTRTGLELALHLAFPGLPVRVEDGGRTAAARHVDALPPAGPVELVVYCDVPVDPKVTREMHRLIDAFKPAHVPHKLRMRERSEGTSA
jgi:phage tail-like protein